MQARAALDRQPVQAFSTSSRSMPPPGIDLLPPGVLTRGQRDRRLPRILVAPAHRLRCATGGAPLPAALLHRCKHQPCPRIPVTLLHRRRCFTGALLHRCHHPPCTSLCAADTTPSRLWRHYSCRQPHFREVCRPAAWFQRRGALRLQLRPKVACSTLGCTTSTPCGCSQP